MGVAKSNRGHVAERRNHADLRPDRSELRTEHDHAHRREAPALRAGAKPPTTVKLGIVGLVGHYPASARACWPGEARVSSRHPA